MDVSIERFLCAYSVSARCFTYTFRMRRRYHQSVDKVVYTEGVLVATRVPELPARNSPTKYGRTEEGGGERERAQARTGRRVRKRGLGRTRRQARVSSGDVCTGAGCRRLQADVSARG